MPYTSLHGLTNVQVAFDNAKKRQDDAYTIFNGMDDYKQLNDLRAMKQSDLRQLVNTTRKCKNALDDLLKADGELATALDGAGDHRDDHENELQHGLQAIRDQHQADRDEISAYLDLVAGVARAIVQAFRGVQNHQAVGVEEEPDLHDIDNLSDRDREALSDRDDLSVAEISQTESVLTD